MSDINVLTPRELAEVYPNGCMPMHKINELFTIRNASIARFSLQDVVSLDDVMTLDRGGRFKVADELFVKCSPQARHALLNDSNPHVRSAAAISSVRVIEAIEAMLTAAVLVADVKKALLYIAEQMKITDDSVAAWVFAGQYVNDWPNADSQYRRKMLQKWLVAEKNDSDLQ